MEDNMLDVFSGNVFVPMKLIESVGFNPLCDADIMRSRFEFEVIIDEVSVTSNVVNSSTGELFSEGSVLETTSENILALERYIKFSVSVNKLLV